MARQTIFHEDMEVQALNLRVKCLEALIMSMKSISSLVNRFELFLQLNDPSININCKVFTINNCHKASSLSHKSRA